MNFKILKFEIIGFFMCFLVPGQISPIDLLGGIPKSLYGPLRHYYILISNDK
jgi:hypothetical protein